MRFLKLRNWPEDLTKVEGALFFAQLWEEMLFDYTIDSFKLRTFNLPALCAELITAYTQCESGVLYWRSIVPLRDEISWHLKHDAMARKVLDATLVELERKITLWNPDSPSKDLSHSCSFIVSELGDLYFSELKAELTRLLETPKEKKKIHRIASALLTEMVRRGFAAPYIYHRLVVFFFGDRPISAIEDVGVFLSRFDEPVKTFTVVAKAPHRGSLLTEGIQADFMAFAKRLPETVPSNTSAHRFDSGEQAFLVFRKVKAMDPYSARRVALGRLEMITSVVRFLRHQLEEDQCTESNWLVCENPISGGTCLDANIIPAPRNISFRRPDVKEDRMQESLKCF